VTDLVKHVEDSITARRLFRRGESVLVAVSGGLDSMTLLHLLTQLAPVHHWHLTVAHFNHQLRGRSSDADERLVERTAKKLDLPFVADRADVRKFARIQKLSLEMAARKLRHAFLARTAAKRKIYTIALAHHADDQLELFFLRLLRGAGAEGLAGMKWRNASPENSKIALVRPLLGEPKSELSFWAAREKIPFREDATNAQLDIQRNRIRHELLPFLARQHQPALLKVVLRQMDILGEESAFVEQTAKEWLKRRNPVFTKLPPALQRRCLQIQLVSAGVPPNFDLIEQLREHADRPIVINSRLSAARDAAGAVSLRKVAEARFNGRMARMDLRGKTGEMVFGQVKIGWEIRPLPGTFRAPKKRLNTELFDADKVGNVIRLRHWQPGDRFQPIGMARAVKLQDLFTNNKILRAERRRLIVGTTAGGELFWVEGLRMAERFKLDKSTARGLNWCWERL
jgi:tRNA(Ile)-lysidine synthase